MALATLDRQELDRFARAFEELFYQGDAAAMAAFYSEDAEVMAPIPTWCGGQMPSRRSSRRRRWRPSGWVCGLGSSNRQFGR
jgi:ketosteroid isomerase-like protein